MPIAYGIHSERALESPGTQGALSGDGGAAESRTRPVQRTPAIYIRAQRIELNRRVTRGFRAEHHQSVLRPRRGLRGRTVDVGRGHGIDPGHEDSPGADRRVGAL